MKPRQKALLISLMVLMLFTGPVSAGDPDAPSSRYMGAPAKLGEAPNGAIINGEVLTELPKTAWVDGPEIEKPVKDVYVLGGYLISASVVVDTDKGLIVFDTGDTKEDGEKLLKAIRSFSKKPIKAFVYLHSHYVFGTGVMAEGDKDVMVIAHPDMNKVVARNMASGGAPAYFPEIGPVLTARALLQFNAYLPKEGPDAWYSPTNIKIGELAYLPVTHPVQDGEVLDVLGEKMQFFTKYGTDDKVHVTVWFPERKMVVENMLWNTPPNMYTTRGDLFRDAREWYQGVKLVRDLRPEVLVGAAHRPIIGKEKIQDTLNAYLDGISFVLDQTLRGILGGYGPEDLRHMVRMPEYLAKDPYNFESYGELSFQPPAIYYYAIGWYNNDAATLFRPSPTEEAERLVNLIGGRTKVLEAAQQAYEEKEYAWAAQLVNYLYKLDPGDKEARFFKAKVLRQLGYLATGANARSHLLSQALALEGKVTIPRLIPPRPEVISGEPETFVEYFRVRIDPKKSGDTDKVLLFAFQGDHKTVGLHIRRAVAEYLDDPDAHYKPADVTLSLSGEAWAKIYLSRATVEELVKSGEVTVKQGTLKDAGHLIGLFDKYRPHKAVLVAPHLHD